MKKLILSFLIILNYFSYSQTGYQKSIKLEYSNAIISAQIINDTLSVCNLSNNLINGFYIDNFLLDTFAIKGKEFKIINDSIPYVGYPGESSKVISYDEFDKTYNYTFSSGGILFIKYSYEKGEVQFIKKYRYRIGKNDQIRPFGIIPVVDGYIIYGDTQWENEQVAVYGFTLKIDKDGNEVAWNILKDEKNAIEFKNGFQNSDSTLLLVSNYIIRKPSQSSSEIQSRIYLYDLKSNTFVNSTIVNNKNNDVFLYNLFPSTVESSSFIGVGYHRLSTTNNIYNPAYIEYDDSFIEKKVTYFGIREEKLSGIQPEWPYQSTMDDDRNIYATTTSLIYPTLEKVDTESIEVITLTKFNPEGDIVWETIDSFDKEALAIKDRWIRPVISSVNVASSGSVFITGYYSDTEEVFVIDTFTEYYYYIYYDSLLMKDTFEIRDSIKIDTITQLNRGVGFLFKYDKDGCRVSGCRIVDTQEETIKEEKLVIYPNPTNDKIHLTSSVNWLNAKVSIVDVKGKTWMNFKHNHRDDIDVSNLPPGIYTFTLEKDGNVQREKFIKL